jgi:hypothetical protein
VFGWLVKMVMVEVKLDLGMTPLGHQMVSLPEPFLIQVGVVQL